MSRPGSRYGRASLLAVLGALALLVLGARPASAHAMVESTSPIQGSELTTAPDSVFLRFSESIGITSHSIEVRDSGGHRVDTGTAFHPGGDDTTVGVRLTPNSAKSSYLVVWHVVSDDSHPVSGTFTFGYGVPAGPAPAAAPAQSAIVAVNAIFRFTAFTGTVLLLGGTFFFCLVWVNGLRLVRSRRLLVAGWAGSAVSTAALFVLQGPYGASLSFADLADPSLIRITLDSSYGRLLLLRLVALAAAAAVWWTIRGTRRPPNRLDAGGLALLIVESFSFGGHAGQGSWVPLAATMDALHVAAASIWLGGLAVLAGALLARSGDAPSAGELATILPRWSRAAMSAVAVLVATGLYQAWREVGSVDALLATTYGRLVLAKAAALGVLLVLANYGRGWIHRNLHRREGREVHTDPTPAQREADRPGEALAAGTAAADGGGHVALATVPASEIDDIPAAQIRRLRRSVGAEAGIGMVVLALTAALVSSEPARESYSPAWRTSLTSRGTDGGRIRIQLVIQPTRSGFETVRIEATTVAGSKFPFQSATGSLTDSALGIGPIDFELLPTGRGEAEATGVAVPAPGRWQLALQVHADQLAGYSARTTYTVT